MSGPEDFSFGMITPDDIEAAPVTERMQADWAPVPPDFAARVYGLAGEGVPRQGGDPTLPESDERPVNAWNYLAGYVDPKTGQPLSQEELNRLGSGWGA